MRSLKSLGVPPESYGGLLSSILINKLPQDFRLVITREVGEDDWKLDQLLQIFTSELEARERAAGPSSSKAQAPPPKGNRKAEGTASTLQRTVKQSLMY